MVTSEIRIDVNANTSKASAAFAKLTGDVKITADAATGARSAFGRMADGLGSVADRIDNLGKGTNRVNRDFIELTRGTHDFAKALFGGDGLSLDNALGRVGTALSQLPGPLGGIGTAFKLGTDAGGALADVLGVRIPAALGEFGRAYEEFRHKAFFSGADGSFWAFVNSEMRRGVRDAEAEDVNKANNSLQRERVKPRKSSVGSGGPEYRANYSEGDSENPDLRRNESALFGFGGYGSDSGALDTLETGQRQADYAENRRRAVGLGPSLADRAAAAEKAYQKKRKAGEAYFDAAEAQQATAALGALGDAFGAAVDAAISGQGGIAKAFAAVAKASLRSVAVQASVNALFETAKGFAALALGSGTAAVHFKAAALFAATATVAGAASAAIPGGGGGGLNAGAGAGGGFVRGGGGRSDEKKLGAEIHKAVSQAQRTGRARDSEVVGYG